MIALSNNTLITDFWSLAPEQRSRLATDALIRFRGNSRRSAEHLHIPESEFVNLLVQDEEDASLNIAKLRLLMTIDLLHVVDCLKLQVLGSLGDLEPKEAADIYTRLMKEMGNLTNSNTSTIKHQYTDESLLKRLPPHVADAIKMLMADPTAETSQLELAPIVLSNDGYDNYAAIRAHDDPND